MKKLIWELFVILLHVKIISWCVLNFLAAGVALADFESACAVKRPMMYALPSWAVTCKLMEPME